ncbi:MAG: hypothetical protein M3Z92_11905 [Bacteroidota bacterium]|nr:hypothetical protein [Bacteroidota bacterium]
MKFFKWLFGHADHEAFDLQKNASGSNPDLDYELQLLDECKRKRDVYIEKMTTLRIEDIDKTIATYEDQVNAYFLREKVIICRIIEEKLSQLKKARDIIQKRINVPAFY